MLSNPSKTWLALIIGNSRLHWGLFNQQTLTKAWDTNYLSTPSPPLPLSPSLPLFIASVVPTQTKFWQNYPNAKFITLNEIALNNLYPTLGIDRALALLAAGETWGFPILVIDTGTALTFTGADSNRNLIGGAILPGLGLQFSTLTNKTGQLPNVELPQQLPPRYAVNTQEAIQSGIIYTIIAGIKDFVAAWLQDFPQSHVVITGGDRTVLCNYLKSQYPEIATKIIVEKNLILWGIREIVRS
ncbi:MAG: pantothenate kinase [Rivularia sp. (in: Bacteria)]|nr:pantothenate kinase [Rivularia sp. MS3]